LCRWSAKTLPLCFAAQSATFESYRQNKLADRDVHDLAIRIWDAGALGTPEIPRLIEEWRERRHPEFTQTPKIAWRLFNAITEIINGDPFTPFWTMAAGFRQSPAWGHGAVGRRFS
jgi:hypothetical protein